ncbi:MAG: cytochrome C551 [Nitrospinae bacterium CG11_big_fil_rev_8_21_14_0_20_56_8]|nr:MAG: cytochrome C551 [Nitrospinae bacterium CG11_big_fil_rev_8_21_14_0_20_56_8]
MAYQNSPTIVSETPGTKHYCTCGESANKPYCDGSHSRLNTGKSPKMYEVTDSRRVAICDCGHTGKSPFCDGTHSTL